MTPAQEVANPHVIRYEALPTQWAEGLPLGNGELGVMCWSDGKHLRFSFDSAGAWDLRQKSGRPDYSQLSYGKLREWVSSGDFEAINAASERMGERDPLYPTKVHLGRLDLSCELDPDSELSLSLADASVHGVLKRGDSEHRLHAFVCRDRNLFCLQIDPWPENAPLDLLPFYVTSPGLTALGHPKLEVSQEDGLTVAVQHILPNTFLALCWNSGGPEVIISYAEGNDAKSARAKAVAEHSQYRELGFSRLFDDHGQSWQEFWSASAISLPERDLEFLWYYGLYVLGSCARLGSNPPGLQGLWAMDGRDPPWRGDYHADMNVQETFWSSLASGHLDLMDVWLDFAFEALPQAEQLTREMFGTEGAFQHCSFLPGYTLFLGGGWYTVAFAWSHTGWLTHLAWSRWRYSKDVAWLAQKGYPIVRSAFQFYSANLEEGDDGRYHIPLSSNPEYGGPHPAGWCRDPNIDIALIRRCCDWVREMEAALQIDELTDRAQEIHERLVGYHLVGSERPVSFGDGASAGNPTVLALWKDKPLDYSHRHPSHLMAIHPAMDITIDGSEEDRRIIDDSMEQYLALGQYYWAGHTYVQMASMAAVMGKPDMAHHFLRCYRERWILSNGLHFNKDIGDRGTSFFSGVPREWLSAEAPFTINETCGISCGMSDMLVQGWGDRVRIFPAVPQKWQDLLFVDLRTEGAFTVSALMRQGRVQWVRIVAGSDGLCRLREPFGEAEFEISGADPIRCDSDLSWDLKAGETVVLHTSGYEQPDLSREAEEIRTQPDQWLNLGRSV